MAGYTPLHYSVHDADTCGHEAATPTAVVSVYVSPDQLTASSPSVLAVQVHQVPPYVEQAVFVEPVATKGMFKD